MTERFRLVSEKCPHCSQIIKGLSEEKVKSNLLIHVKAFHPRKLDVHN